MCLVVPTGLEPVTPVLSGLCSTNWAMRQLNTQRKTSRSDRARGGSKWFADFESDYTVGLPPKLGSVGIWTGWIGVTASPIPINWVTVKSTMLKTGRDIWKFKLLVLGRIALLHFYLYKNTKLVSIRKIIFYKTEEKSTIETELLYTLLTLPLFLETNILPSAIGKVRYPYLPLGSSPKSGLDIFTISSESRVILYSASLVPLLVPLELFNSICKWSLLGPTTVAEFI